MLLAAALAACGPTTQDAYPDCLPVATGGVVCEGSDQEAWLVGEGLGAWAEVYAAEFGDDAARYVAGEVAVYYGEIEDDDRCPCVDGCRVAGCCDTSSPWPELWVNTMRADGSQAWPPTTTALLHETVHAAERLLEGSVDYEHDDHPHRWGRLLDAARARWAERIGIGGCVP